MNWTLSVIIICIILLLLFGWQEIKRADRRRLSWRLLAIVLAVAALACLALPLSYRGQIPVADQSTGILLTEGFNKDSIPVGSPVFTLDKAIQKNYAKAQLINSLQELTNRKPALKQIKILGYGLEDYELKQLKNIPVSYTPAPAPSGIQSISWPAKLKTGEALNLQGKFKNNEGSPVKLILKGLNTTLDSVIIPSGKTSNFQLAALPKLTGRVVYQLLSLSGKDTLANESIPLEIEPTKPIKVLLLSASPNFEDRFLKNWLGENGYAVAARASISKDKASEEYFNLEKLNLQHITTTLLDKFDVIIGDLSALKSLTPAEGGALKQQVTQKGLGVIIRADSSGKAASWLQSSFPVNTVAVKEQLSVPLILQNSKTKTARLNIDPTYIGYRNNTQSLVTDAQNHELAATTLAGAGKLVFTTLNHTYTWMLAGNKQDYASLWSLLINQSARKLPPSDNWKVDSPFPNVNEPVILTLQSSVAPSSIAINDQPVSPAQNAATPYEWQSTYFPQKTGWQQAKWGGRGQAWWYVNTKKSWSSLKKLKKAATTHIFVANQSQKDTVTKQIQQKVKIEVSKIWFYLILLASCTFLWVERKFTT
ncbi:hypothetical protein MUGA111182_09395 [Mucilaginibacter galii]|uniref:Aerotolerance regulator N-terminal domain-containing protein n=1 Tax=Mucilaginibacter galii TaxID=2005073 RepID=A0A917J636_9SPHI|nr:hypothetical protein [Mucilaginibacter galii]GGI49359.1 hypothetical protein GCM10011425_05710 [Mucilaginibacter galii]